MEAKIETIVYKELKLTLTLSEAEWLRDYMQNSPLYEEGVADPSCQSEKNRKELFHTLKDQLVSL